MSLLAKTVDMILPPRCIITGEIVDAQGMVSPKAWGELNFIADPMCQRCGLPFDFMEGNVVDDNALCAGCIKSPPNFTQLRSSLIYDDASRNIILSFKHADQMQLVISFVPWLKNAGQDMLAEADFLMPVPLHRWRILRRRFNQSALIAQKLGKHIGVKCLSDGLARIRHTPTQGYLRTKERHQNVKHAFEVNPKHLDVIKGKKIVLIDDVFTTGATVEECTKKLLKSGALSVSILTLARVVKPSQKY